MQGILRICQSKLLTLDLMLDEDHPGSKRQDSRQGGTSMVMLVVSSAALKPAKPMPPEQK